MTYQNGTVQLISHQAVVSRWMNLLRQTYPEWDYSQLEAAALEAVQDFCGSLAGDPILWNLQTFLRVLPEPTALSALTRILVAFRCAIREEIAHCEAAMIIHVMEQMDAWVDVVIDRNENTRADRNRKRFVEVVERIGQINTLSHCITTLNASLDLVSALNAGSQLGQVLTGADLCAVYQREGNSLRLRSYAGGLSRPREVFEICLANLRVATVVDECRQDMAIEVVRQNLAIPTVQACSCIPLYAGNVVVGRLVIVFGRPQQFSLQQLRQQEIFASHLGQVIHNAQFYEHLSELTTSNERRRIACEMHDTMLQTLVSLNINLRMLLGYAHQEAWDKLTALLDETRQLGKIAIQEGRDTLNNLRDERSCACIEEDLIDCLEPQLTAFAEQSGITPRLKLNGERPYVSLNVAHQIRRLVGEALNNIHRHAHARMVQIVVEASPAEICVCICDDGIGFHPNRVDRYASFGLSGMRERSRLINAQLTIDSELGRGTTIKVRCPRDKEDWTA